MPQERHLSAEVAGKAETANGKALVRRRVRPRAAVVLEVALSRAVRAAVLDLLHRLLHPRLLHQAAVHVPKAHANSCSLNAVVLRVKPVRLMVRFKERASVLPLAARRSADLVRAANASLGVCASKPPTRSLRA